MAVQPGCQWQISNLNIYVALAAQPASRAGPGDIAALQACSLRAPSVDGWMMGCPGAGWWLPVTWLLVCSRAAGQTAPSAAQSAASINACDSACQQAQLGGLETLLSTAFGAGWTPDLVRLDCWR